MSKTDARKLLEIIGEVGNLAELNLRSRIVQKPAISNSQENINESDIGAETTENIIENNIGAETNKKMSNENLNNFEDDDQGAEAYLNKGDVQLLVNSIPEFRPDGNLSIFITEVDNLFAHIGGRLTQDLEYAINFAIRNRIKNEAREFVAHQGASKWEDIKNALMQRYGDSRSEELLVAAVVNCVQKKGETYLEFYTRLIKAYNSLIEHVILNKDGEFTKYKKVEYSELAMRTFQNGVREPYRSFLSHFEFANLEECLNKCRTLDNKHQQWEYTEFLRKTQDMSIGPKPYASPNNQPRSPSYPSHSKPFYQKGPQASFNPRPSTPYYPQKANNFYQRQGQPNRYERPQQYNNGGQSGNFQQNRPFFGKPGGQPQNTQPFRAYSAPRPQQGQYAKPWPVKQEPRELFNAEVEEEDQRPQEETPYNVEPAYEDGYYGEENEPEYEGQQDEGNFREPASEPPAT